MPLMGSWGGHGGLTTLPLTTSSKAAKSQAPSLSPSPRDAGVPNKWLPAPRPAAWWGARMQRSCAVAWASPRGSWGVGHHAWPGCSPHAGPAAKQGAEPTSCSAPRCSCWLQPWPCAHVGTALLLCSPWALLPAVPGWGRTCLSSGTQGPASRSCWVLPAPGRGDRAVFALLSPPRTRHKHRLAPLSQGWEVPQWRQGTTGCPHPLLVSLLDPEGTC